MPKKVTHALARYQYGGKRKGVAGTPTNLSFASCVCVRWFFVSFCFHVPLLCSGSLFFMSSPSSRVIRHPLPTDPSLRTVGVIQLLKEMGPPAGWAPKTPSIAERSTGRTMGYHADLMAEINSVCLSFFLSFARSLPLLLYLHSGVRAMFGLPVTKCNMVLPALQTCACSHPIPMVGVCVSAGVAPGSG